MNVLVVRQSAVLPTDKGQPKIWRELAIADGLAESVPVTLYCSGFDHYGKEHRRSVPTSIGRVRLKVLSTVGYTKNISFRRVIDGWVFGIKLFISVLISKQKFTHIVCSYPTAESVLFSSLLARLKGAKLVLDCRDDWVSIQKKSIVRKLFSFYNKAILFSCKSSISGLIGFSDEYQIRVERIIGLRPRFSFWTRSTAEGQKANDLVRKKSLTGVFVGTLNEQFQFDALNRFDSDSFNFIIIGGGDEQDKLKNKFSKNNVRFLGRKSFNEAQKYVFDADFTFFFYQQPILFEGHVTNKTIEFCEVEKVFIHNLSGSFLMNGISLDLGLSLDLFSDIITVDSFMKKAERFDLPESVWFEGERLKRFIMDLGPKSY